MVEENEPAAELSASSPRSFSSSEGGESPHEEISNPSSTFKPKVPKYGGLEQLGTDYFVAWTGGKPKYDWTELADPSPKEIQPNQYRPTSISTQAKSQAFRRMGLDPKYSKGDDILLFQHNVLEHLIDHGLDTVTYVPDPASDGAEPKDKEMLSIINYYGKFTLEDGSQLGDEIMMLHYDAYDKNVIDAKKFLYNSVDDHLKKQLK